MPTAALAHEGKGEFKASDHCQFYKVKATCRKRAETNLELAKYDFEIPAILPRIDQLISWGNDIKEHALSKAQAVPTMTVSNWWEAEVIANTQTKLQLLLR